MPNLNEQINEKLGQLQSEIERLRESELRDLVVKLVEEIRVLITTLNVTALADILKAIVQKINDIENHLKKQDQVYDDKFKNILSEISIFRNMVESGLKEQLSLQKKKFKVLIWSSVIIIIVSIAIFILSLLTFIKH